LAIRQATNRGDRVKQRADNVDSALAQATPGCGVARKRNWPDEQLLGHNAAVVIALSDAVRLLVFPLIILIAGAAVSGLLVPALTRRRDDHRKALEVKTALVGEMSQVVMEFMMAIQFAVRYAAEDQEAFDDAFSTWEVRSAVIATELEAYYPTTSIGADWSAFASALRGSTL
jgi:hypothetical protein